MAKASFHPVILVGGSGSRLWPASTPERPKAFLALAGTRTLLQETALRVTAAQDAAAPIVVAAVIHAETVRAQLHEADVGGLIIGEPGGRGSAPAIAVAALEVAEVDPEGVVLALACDHHIPDTPAFLAGVEAALPAATAGAIVTFGIRPNAPSGAYGYIVPGETVAGAVRAVTRFVEKPPPAEAAALIAAGASWNSGNFLFRADIMLEELSRLAPEILASAEATRAGASRAHGLISLGEEFLAAPEVAIDVAVMEKTDRAAVLTVDYPWSDLGAWDAVLAASTRNAAGNATAGAVVMIDSENCLVRAGPGARVAIVGLTNIAVVVEGDRVLVCDLAHAQAVRDAATWIEKG